MYESNGGFQNPVSADGLLGAEDSRHSEGGDGSLRPTAAVDVESDSDTSSQEFENVDVQQHLIDNAGDYSESLAKLYLLLDLTQRVAIWTMPNFIIWPPQWLTMIRLTFGFSFTLTFGMFDVIMPSSPALALFVQLAVPVLILARGLYLLKMMRSSSWKSKWLSNHRTREAWRDTKRKAIFVSVVVPFAVVLIGLFVLWGLDNLLGTNFMWTEREDDWLSTNTSNASEAKALHTIDVHYESEQALSVVATTMLALCACSWVCGASSVLYTVGLRARYEANEVEGGTDEEFFASWQFGESGLLLLLFSASYLGTSLACWKRMMRIDIGDQGLVILTIFAGSVCLLSGIMAVAGLKHDHVQEISWTFHRAVKVHLTAYLLQVFAVAATAYLALVPAVMILNGVSPTECLVSLFFGPIYTTVPVVLITWAAWLSLQDSLASATADGGEAQMSNSEFEEAVEANLQQLKNSGDADRIEKAAFVSLISSYEAKYWWTKPFLMIEKVTGAGIVLFFRGQVRLFWTVTLCVAALLISFVTRPYLRETEDFMDIVNRLGTVIIMMFGAALETELITQDHANIGLLAISSVLGGMYMYTLRHLPGETYVVVKQIGRKYLMDKVYRKRWSQRTVEKIAHLTYAEIRAMTGSEIAQASNEQRLQLYMHMLKTRMDFTRTQMNTGVVAEMVRNKADELIDLGVINLVEQNDTVKTMLGFDPGVKSVNLHRDKYTSAQAKMLAAELRLGRNTSEVQSVTSIALNRNYTKCTRDGNNYTDQIGIEGADALIDALELNGQIQTILGIDRDTELDLRPRNQDNDVDLAAGPVVDSAAQLLAAELRLQRNAASVVHINLLGNHIEHKVADVLIAAFEQNEQIQTLLGLEAEHRSKKGPEQMQTRRGLEVEHRSKKGPRVWTLDPNSVGPVHLRIIAAELRMQRYLHGDAQHKTQDKMQEARPVEKIVLSNNACTDDDKDLVGLTALCEPLVYVTEIVLRDCNLGDASADVLAKGLQDDHCVLTKVDLISNTGIRETGKELLERARKNLNQRRRRLYSETTHSRVNGLNDNAEDLTSTFQDAIAGLKLKWLSSNGPRRSSRRVRTSSNTTRGL